MTQLIKFSFIMGLIAVLFHPVEGFAMGRNVTFVDSGYEGQSMKGQPSGKGTSFTNRTPHYYVVLRYPTDHRVEKWPLKQRITLQIESYNRPGTFQVFYWSLIDQNGNEIPLTHGITDHNSLLHKEFKANGIPLDFFSDIPKDVDQLSLEFKIEIKTPAGTEILEKKIPLKRANFKTSFSEVFWRHERW